MRTRPTIAFTHNLKRSAEEAQAEFDTHETVQAICVAFERSGYDVVPIDVNKPLAALVQALEAARASVVFNTAEGFQGRAREALYPALFEQLGLPYVGSDAYTMTLTLDKALSRLVAQEAGVQCPRQVLRVPGDGNHRTYPLPCIVKPCYEGSSKGITQDSVVLDGGKLHETVRRAMERYPEGVLIEEFIAGSDVTVPYVEGIGVLSPCSYRFPATYVNPTGIYDYKLKNEWSDRVEVSCPADLSEATAVQIVQEAHRLVRAFNLKGAARLDFRVRTDGEVFFLEANATPSMEEGASLFEAARRSHGLRYAEVLCHMVETVLQRQHPE